VLLTSKGKRDYINFSKQHQKTHSQSESDFFFRIKHPNTGHHVMAKYSTKMVYCPKVVLMLTFKCGFTYFVCLFECLKAS